MSNALHRIHENKLKSEFVRLARWELPNYLIEPIQDRLTSGVPDLIITGNGYCSRWEFKHANPKFQSTGIQELTMKRLQKAGGNRARYVIYSERVPGCLATHVVWPSELAQWETESAWSYGFDHQFVIGIVRRLHSDNPVGT